MKWWRKGCGPQRELIWTHQNISLHTDKLSMRIQWRMITNNTLRHNFSYWWFSYVQEDLKYEFLQRQLSTLQWGYSLYICFSTNEKLGGFFFLFFWFLHYHNSTQLSSQQLCQNHFQMLTKACINQSIMHLIPLAPGLAEIKTIFCGDKEISQQCQQKISLLPLCTTFHLPQLHVTDGGTETLKISDGKPSVCHTMVLKGIWAGTN